MTCRIILTTSLGLTLLLLASVSEAPAQCSSYSAFPDPELTGTPAVRQIVDRRLIYNNSFWDTNTTWCRNTAFSGHPVGTPCSDDTAVVPNKIALLPGQTATRASYSTYTRGINGLMIDVERDPILPPLTVVDVANTFTFEKKYRRLSADAVAAGISPTDISVYPHPTLPNVDRIKLIFPDSTALNRHWLKITIKSEISGGIPDLVLDDVFYFGLAIGDALNDPGVNVLVDTADQIAPRPPNHHSSLCPAPFTDAVDYNRDSLVDTTDQVIPRPPFNSSTLNCLILGVAP